MTVIRVVTQAEASTRSRPVEPWSTGMEAGMMRAAGTARDWTIILSLPVREAEKSDPSASRTARMEVTRSSRPRMTTTIQDWTPVTWTDCPEMSGGEAN